MKDNLAGKVIAGALLAWVLAGKPDIASFIKQSAPSPATPVSTDPALDARVKAALVGPSVKADSARLAAMYEGLAGVIEFDGKLQTPQLKTTDSLKQLQEIARVYSLEGATLAEKYPGLVQVVGDTLKAAVGDDVAPLDAGLRAKAAAAYRSLSQSIARASQ